VAPDWRIVRASANVADFLPGHAGEIVDGPLSDLFGNEAVHTLRNRLSLLRDAEGIVRFFALQVPGTPAALDIMMHMAGSETILEAQPRTGQDSGDPIGLVRELARRLDTQSGRSDFFQEAARLLRALTGFEGATLFRYDEAGITELVAHCARGDVAPSDPPSVERSRLRFISEAGARPVAIAPAPEAELLSASLLRAPSDIEKAEMGSAASMLLLPLRAGSVRLGVAVCVDRSPRNLNLERIAAVELFGDLVALRLAILDR
jgi:light-regulated signal transduction histidine kinase (bacteriophytochrome)